MVHEYNIKQSVQNFNQYYNGYKGT